MTRTPPPADWIVYVVVLGTVAAIMLGKYLIGKGADSLDNTKSTGLKKSEIIAQYEDELTKLLIKYENNKDEKLQQKKIYLQKCSSELSRNIFFTPEESKDIIQKLASL